MNNTQHITIMAIEESPADNEGFVSIENIMSKSQMSLGDTQVALKYLFDRGYISSATNGKHKLKSKGLYYVYLFEPIDDRLNYHTNEISSRISCLFYLVVALIFAVLAILLKVFI